MSTLKKHTKLGKHQRRCHWVKIASASTWLHRRKRTQDHQRHVDVIRLKIPFDTHLSFWRRSCNFESACRRGACQDSGEVRSCPGAQISANCWAGRAPPWLLRQTISAQVVKKNAEIALLSLGVIPNTQQKWGPCIFMLANFRNCGTQSARLGHFYYNKVKPRIIKHETPRGQVGSL